MISIELVIISGQREKTPTFCLPFSGQYYGLGKKQLSQQNFGCIQWTKKKQLNYNPI